MPDHVQELAIRALVEHDPQAWPELFAVMTPRLYGLARRLGVPEDRCEDLLQETWCKLLRYAWHEGIPFVPVAFKTLRNLWIDAVRREARRPRLASLADGDGQADDGPSAADLLAALERAEHIRACLDRLTEEERNLIRWHYGEEQLSHAAIGARLGLTAAQVRGKCYRAVQKFLAHVEGDETAAAPRPARARRRAPSRNPGGARPPAPEKS
jgi:RNA polymerase sigma-70 factor (ECF subfamily)